MSEDFSPSDFELRLLPDWLKEPTAVNRFANFAGEETRESRNRGPHRDGGRDGFRKPREGGRGRDERRPSGKGPAPQQARAGNKDRPPRREPGQGPRSDSRDARQEAPAPEPVVIPNVQFDFLPEPRALEAIREKVIQSKQAYPLFALAKMFLERGERCLVKVHSQDAEKPVWQIGSDGEIALEKATLEKSAFEANRTALYEEIKIEGEEIRGNFSNVARCQSSGTLLGPTNHHGFQPALRELYDARFKKRMSFEDFRRQIEIVSDAEVVAQWKEQARVSVRYRALDLPESEPFASMTEVFADFRERHLDKLVRFTPSASCSGGLINSMQDRRLSQAILDARFEAAKFPLRMANHLRNAFSQHNGHVFKHKKRVMYATALRPEPFSGDLSQLAPCARGILETIRKEPLCERRRLLEVLEPAALLPDADPAKVTEAKTRLASDLHWLLHAGHVLEFHTGRFDLPLEKRQDTHNADAGSESAEDHEDSSLEPPKAEAATIVHEATSEQEPESPAAPAEIETSPLDHENAPASTVPEAPLENLKISEPNAIESDPVETPNPVEPAHQQAQQ